MSFPLIIKSFPIWYINEVGFDKASINSLIFSANFNASWEED